VKARAYRSERIRIVSREYHTALVALGILERHLRADPSALARYDLRPTDFHNLKRNLEATYSVRVFAEFESGLRDVWKRTVRDTHPRTYDLIELIGTRRTVPGALVREVQEVREYRNALVHEEAADATPVPMQEATRRLLRFFSYMPADW
jgi:hypothetical protein